MIVEPESVSGERGRLRGGGGADRRSECSLYLGPDEELYLVVQWELGERGGIGADLRAGATSASGGSAATASGSARRR